MATRTVVKYLTDDGLMLPAGTPVAFGLDDDGALAVWLEHLPPIDVDPTLMLFMVSSDSEFMARGDYVGTAVHGGVEWHLFNGGLITA